MDPKLFDMNSIFSVAQQIAKDIKLNNPNINNDSDNVDMSSIIQQVTQSVSNVVTPDLLDKLGSGSSVSQKHTNSHKKHNKSIKNTSTKTPDINFDVPITLYDSYYGKTKRINVKVDRLKKDDDGQLKLIKEKNKLVIEIEKGVVDGTVIKFEGEGDHKPGFKTGDINVTIRIEDCDKFERDENNLIYHHFCSLSDCYNLKFNLTHINGNTYKILSKTTTFNFTNPIKIIKGLGMPIVDSETENDKYGDLIVLLHFALPFKFDEEQLTKLSDLFPPIVESTLVEEDIDETMFAEDPEDEDDDDEDDDDEDDDDEDDEEDDKDILSMENSEKDEITYKNPVLDGIKE